MAQPGLKARRLSACSDKVEELPAAGIETGDDPVFHLGKDGVGLAGEENLDAIDGLKAGFKTGGPGIGIFGVLQPGPVFEDADPGGAEVAHL